MAIHDITVAVGGRHELARAGLAALVASLPGLRVVPLEKNPPPQVLVWETETGVDGLPSVRPDTAILLLTEETGYESLPEMVAGLLSKDEQPSALGLAIRQVARGEQYISPSLAVAILQKRQSYSTLTESEKSVIESLTDREREILD